MATQEAILLYILVGAVCGIIYSLRRIYIVERKIRHIDIKIEHLIEKLIREKKKR